MSWDYGLQIDTGGAEPFELTDWNLTYNLSPMLAKALGVGFRGLDGAPCTEAAGVIARAVDRMKADPATFKALNPENGWGDYDGALEALQRLLVGCGENPKASIYVH